MAHVLITVQPEYEENAPAAARARIEQISEKLALDPAQFPALAKAHSECPTALAEGVLGWLERGKLYATVEEAGFALPKGGISGPVESPLGWHVVQCRDIRPAATVSFDHVRTRLEAALRDHTQELQY